MNAPKNAGSQSPSDSETNYSESLFDKTLTSDAIYDMEAEWEQDEADEEEDEDSETPMYDFTDDVLRCKRCGWEVAEGICQGGCGMEYKYDPVSLLLFFD